MISISDFSQYRSSNSNQDGNRTALEAELDNMENDSAPAIRSNDVVENEEIEFQYRKDGQQTTKNQNPQSFGKHC